MVVMAVTSVLYLQALQAVCFFADDILLLSASILHLQCVLELCNDYGNEYDISLNQKSRFHCKLV